MKNNNKKGRPTLESAVRRDKPLIIRLSEKERAVIKAKMRRSWLPSRWGFRA